MTTICEGAQPNPFVDLRNHFHIDHIFPANRFTLKRLTKAGIPEARAEEWQPLFNKLPNLQLLEGAFNNEKREKLPADWLQARYPVDADRKHYCMIHDLGEVPEEIRGFDDFFAARRERIRAKIEATVNAA